MCKVYKRASNLKAPGWRRLGKDVQRHVPLPFPLSHRLWLKERAIGSGSEIAAGKDMYRDVQVYRRCHNWAYQIKLLIRQIVTALARPEHGALAANTKNEFYISTFAIICIIYDVLGNVVKLRPLKMLRVCVGHPSAASERWRWKVKTLSRELEKSPKKQLCLSAGPQIFMRLTGILKHSGSWAQIFKRIWPLDVEHSSLCLTSKCCHSLGSDGLSRLKRYDEVRSDMNDC